MRKISNIKLFLKRRDLHKKNFKKFRGGRNREAGGDANQVFILFYLALPLFDFSKIL
jgi:hypothetical protein